ncbi:DUF1365-domain-containing protein [Meredithblackwellia eburnea MCA 4105]
MNVTSTTTEAIARPLLSWRPGWLDVILPPLLIALSLLLHTLYSTPYPYSTANSSHIFRAKTAHARLLPVESRHVFSYPVLYFGVDLAKLERGELDLGEGWGSLFKWEPLNWAITAFRREAYLEAGRKEGVRGKVLKLLEERGVDTEEDAKMVYMVSMPAYLGMEGINPLTVHYCYGAEVDSKRPLKVVVLEVHNTFEERHVYILRAGMDEDEKVVYGFEHQWTFPRAFHVSPFNSRLGHYRVSVSSPFSTSSTCPTINIKVVFLTPTFEKKLYASLNGVGEPLSQSTLLKSLLSWPFDLLLTTPRILWEAAKLSYSKGLAVYIRPEPFAGSREGGNPVQEGATVGSVGWQDIGGMEKWAKTKVVQFLEKRRETWEGKENVRVVLRSVDISVQDVEVILRTPSSDTRSSKHQQLLVTYNTPVFFTDLLVTPSMLLALQLGSHTEHRWHTEDEPLFLSVFSAFSPPVPTLTSRMTQKVRIDTMNWGLSFASLHCQPPPPAQTMRHPFDDGKLRTLWMTWSHSLALKVGYWILCGSRAKVIEGTESWGEWKRWSEKQNLKQG